MSKQRKSPLKSLLAALLCAVLLLGVMPAPVWAATQAEVDALAVQRDELRRKRQAVQDQIDALQAEQSSILEMKRVLDERAEYNKQEMLLNEQEIALYDQMIEDKAKDVEAARALEEQQLERYRTRVRAMEENGGYNILALVLKTSNLGELLTAMDDIGEIMQSDRELEDDYIAAREHTEAVKAEYEAYKAELEVKQDELRAVQEQLQKEIDEAVAYVAQIDEQIRQNGALAEQFKAEEAQVQAVLNQKIAELEAERKRREEEAKAARGRSGCERRRLHRRRDRSRYRRLDLALSGTYLHHEPRRQPLPSDLERVALPLRHRYRRQHRRRCCGGRQRYGGGLRRIRRIRQPHPDRPRQRLLHALRAPVRLCRERGRRGQQGAAYRLGGQHRLGDRSAPAFRGPQGHRCHRGYRKLLRLLRPDLCA